MAAAAARHRPAHRRAHAADVSAWSRSPALDGIAAPLDIAKIDTGMIVPGRFQRIRRRPGHADYADVFLHDLRFDEHDRPRPDFVLNQPAYRGAKFSSRAAISAAARRAKAPPMRVLDYGVRALIGPSFGDVFVGNCMQNGIVPVVLPIEAVQALWRQLKETPGATITVDLPAQTVTAPDGARLPLRHRPDAQGAAAERPRRRRRHARAPAADRSVRKRSYRAECRGLLRTRVMKAMRRNACMRYLAMHRCCTAAASAASPRRRRRAGSPSARSSSSSAPRRAARTIASAARSSACCRSMKLANP